MDPTLLFLLLVLFFMKEDAEGSSLVIPASSAPNAPHVPPQTPPPAPAASGGFVASGPVFGQLAPAYFALKPVADNITTPLINKLNASIGGTDIYGPGTAPTFNADGTATNVQGGATITYNPDGTITRHTLPLSVRHPTIYAAGKAAEGAGSGIVSVLKSIL